MNPNIDYILQYKNISNKLKKRFLKKPNIAEVSKQYSDLANTFTNEDCHNYAGIIFIAKASCESTLNNYELESSAYLDAARSFMKQQQQSLGCPMFNEHSISAEHCYIKAINIYLNNNCKQLAASISCEIANSFMNFKNYSKAIIHFRQASILQYSNSLNCLNSLSLMAICYIQIRDYEKALDVYTEIAFIVLERGLRHQSGRNKGTFLQIYKNHECNAEISIVLLLLYLKPKSNHICPEHAHILHKYYWSNDEKCCLSDFVYQLMKSILMASESKDKIALYNLQSIITTHLSSHQNTLLSLIIESNKSSG